VLVARLVVAAVWWYEGLIRKILGLDGAAAERAVVASLPGLSERAVTVALAAIGAVEVLLGIWVLTGVRARAAAVVQTVLLVAFNAGGLAFGAARIDAPGRMLVHNAVLLVLAWVVATRPVRQAGTADG
jgi:uncharacterized membrane protein YphA (DoxX/SURF4 family)